jgi:hypothetical protein
VTNENAELQTILVFVIVVKYSKVDEENQAESRVWESFQTQVQTHMKTQLEQKARMCRSSNSD